MLIYESAMQNLSEQIETEQKKKGEQRQPPFTIQPRYVVVTINFQALKKPFESYLLSAKHTEQQTISTGHNKITAPQHN